MAQSWVYVDGEVSSRPAEPAQGQRRSPRRRSTFDPDTVLAQVRRDLPDSSIDLFFVEGGPNGTVRYTALLTSSAGGQLQVVVAPDGSVQQVDPG